MKLRTVSEYALLVAFTGALIAPQIIPLSWAQAPVAAAQSFTLTMTPPEIDLQYRALVFYAGVLNEGATTHNPAVDLLVDKERVQIMQQNQAAIAAAAKAADDAKLAAAAKAPPDVSAAAAPAPKPPAPPAPPAAAEPPPPAPPAPTSPGG